MSETAGSTAQAVLQITEQAINNYVIRMQLRINSGTRLGSTLKLTVWQYFAALKR